jgi:hypothetical protein
MHENTQLYHALVACAQIQEAKKVLKEHDFALVDEEKLWQTADGTENTPQTTSAWRGVYQGPDGSLACLMPWTSVPNKLIRQKEA